MTPFQTTSKPFPHGTFAKIARLFGVTPQAVSLVAQGKSKSHRIEVELRREWRKAQRQAAPVTRPRLAQPIDPALVRPAPRSTDAGRKR